MIIPFHLQNEDQHKRLRHHQDGDQPSIGWLFGYLVSLNRKIRIKKCQIN